MRITRVYQEKIDTILDDTASHYLARVLRCRINDACILFNGQGIEVPATITDISKTSVTVRLDQPVECHRESPLFIHLAQAVPKGDKMDWILQKATELGAQEITPLWTEYSDVKFSTERLKKKLTHWQRVLISAAEQSGRTVLPKLNPPCTLKELSITQPTVLLSPRGNQSLTTLTQPPPTQLMLCIGPEGGFSVEEETWATQQNIILIKMGTRILRTETAAMSAIATAQILWGDFK